MPQVKCPFPSCDYETADLDAATVAALITTHSIIHNNAPTPVTAEKAPPRHLLARARTGVTSCPGGQATNRHKTCWHGTYHPVTGVLR